MTDFVRLEAVVDELLALYGYRTAPIPIEAMLQHPQPLMWSEVDVSQISIGYFNMNEPYAARMSLARLLARHLITCEWGRIRGLPALGTEAELRPITARILTMPAPLVFAIHDNTRTATLMRQHFEVPSDEAEKRLGELAQYRSQA